MAVDHRAMKLGLKPPQPSLRLPGMDRLGVALPTAAPAMDWGRAVAPGAWGMDGNDRWGCCTIAGVDHAQRLWHATCGGPVGVMTEPETLANYTAVSGFDPADPSTDTGAMLSDVMLRWQRVGFEMGGALDRAAAFVRVEPRALNEVKLAIQWFGAAVVGINMPLTAQRQEVWQPAAGPDGEPGSWGGHCVVLVGYDDAGLTCITWGAPKRLTWPFWHECGGEAWAVLSPDWIERSGASPAGIDLAGLRADLAEMEA